MFIAQNNVPLNVPSNAKRLIEICKIHEVTITRNCVRFKFNSVTQDQMFTGIILRARSMPGNKSSD